MYNKKLCVCLFFLISSFVSYAQKGTYTEFQTGVGQRIGLDQNVTAIAVRTEDFLGEQIELTINGAALLLPFDHDAPNYSYFISLERPLSSFQIDTDLELTIGLINSGDIPTISTSSSRINQQTCEFEIDPIPQSEWRAGLEPPSYNRAFTDVDHVIIHHAAGSNTNTNYTQVVRDIYIYHTQSNGWSDIGYNYLIAQNGALYAGRDPDGGAQDNVLGAHFCGSNSGTMGVCLLGNYQTAVPTASTWQTLEVMAAFKTQKEGLDPLASEPHPLGNIGHIAGHRDGCSTACPGQNVYDQLQSLREQTAENLHSCGKDLSLEADVLTINAGAAISYTNTSTGYDEYFWWFEGGDPTYANWAESGTVTYPYGGTFDVQLIGKVGELHDTLTHENIVVVRGEVTLFPNPVSSLDHLSISISQPLVSVKILGVDGKEYYVRQPENPTIEVPVLRQGMYLLRIETSERILTRKFLVQ